MRKFTKKTLTTITACLVVAASASVATEGFIPAPEDTDIVVDMDFGFDEEETEAPEVQPLADDPDFDKKE